jgi:two-component system chemotaxis response regulator CheY
MAVDLAMPVLVVDDSPEMGKLVCKLLMFIGFKNVDYLPDGYTALSRVHQMKFGLVICEWNMRPMNGLTLLNEVRGAANLAGLPFIVISSEATRANVVAAQSAGASAFLIKPFTGKLLRDKIDKLFSSNKSMADAASI